MIQELSYLEVADNSGARKLMCIRVLGGSKKKFAKVGDVIKVSIKEAIPTGRVKKGNAGSDGRWNANPRSSLLGAGMYLLVNAANTKL